MAYYDSTPDTIAHIARVRQLLVAVQADLGARAAEHDRSKLQDPEKAVFDEYTPKLRESTYGSDEYKQFLEGMGEGLQHHYEHNGHHPEHWPLGIMDMSLLDLIEMLADWKAATERHADGSLDRSITQNRERFGYDKDFETMLRHTASELGWL